MYSKVNNNERWPSIRWINIWSGAKPYSQAAKVLLWHCVSLYACHVGSKFNLTYQQIYGDSHLRLGCCPLHNRSYVGCHSLSSLWKLFSCAWYDSSLFTQMSALPTAYKCWHHLTSDFLALIYVQASYLTQKIHQNNKSAAVDLIFILCNPVGIRNRNLEIGNNVTPIVTTYRNI